MGKLQSKHAAECFLVNAQLNRALEEQIWKKKSGLDLANFNMDESLSELSICLEDKCGTIPLRVELPPQGIETDTSKMLKLDHGDENDNSDENKDDKANNLNIEEFECGVQFEGAENSKQEWSFTLYDFDGHGRITKEDLASLLKALYDAVGSSIRLPPNGAKTLKLRLTVGQDRTQIHTLTTGKALAGGKRKENSGSVSQAKTSKESPLAVKQQFSKLNNLTRTNVKCNNQVQEAAGQSQSQVEGNGATARKQLTPEDHQQLAELVQENMERNHVRQLRRHHSDFHSPPDKSHHKRRHRGRAGGQSKNASAPGITPAPSTTTAAALALADDTGRAVESQDRRNYYLDLAGVDSSNLNNASANINKIYNNPSIPGAGSGPATGTCNNGGHHRSRSYDVNSSNAKCDNAKREMDRMVENAAKHQQLFQQNHLRSRSFDPQDSGGARVPKSNVTLGTCSGANPADPVGGGGAGIGGVGGGVGNSGGASCAAAAAGQAGVDGAAAGPAGSPHKHGRFRPVSLPGHVPASVSPHYHRRHRHREKDHDLAMQQVAAWIEREHAWDFDGERVIVQRHHHHHIHEHHHHHHYHHYYES